MAYCFSKACSSKNFGIRTSSVAKRCPRQRAQWFAVKPERPRRPEQWKGRDAKERRGEEPRVESVPETTKNPAMNSQILDSMRKYFGDDGREAEKYTSRPKGKDGKPRFRVVVIGSGEKEVEIARTLVNSDRVFGLYYCTEDVDEPVDLEDRNKDPALAISDYCNYVRVEEPKAEQIIEFCRWAQADAVFEGSNCDNTTNKDLEKELAKEKVTFFAYDISAAVAAGNISVDDCLAGLTQEFQRKQSKRSPVVE